MSIQSEEELNKAYLLLEEGKTSEAKQTLENAFEYSLENQEFSFAHTCCCYWESSIQNLQYLSRHEQGESLISKWKSFRMDYERPDQYVSQRTIYAIQQGVFKLALKAFESLKEESNAANQADICRKKGLCCKKLGRYEDALHYLTEANSLSPSSAAVLSEMADCFALCGEEKNAKVLFREAFFIDAQKVELAFLDSELIKCLIRQVREIGYFGSALQEWIPVYGVLYGVFNIKRELKTAEVARLRQDIFAKENEIKDPANDVRILTPKLINMYFWLIDHYVRTNDSKIRECLLQIRVHDEKIYKMYTKE